jgi:hypothetical protein
VKSYSEYNTLVNPTYITQITQMLRWNLKSLLAKAGNPNANQLAKLARLNYPTARRILQDIKDERPLDRIETVTLEALAEAFGVKPLSLLEHAPDKK